MLYSILRSSRVHKLYSSLSVAMIIITMSACKKDDDEKPRLDDGVPTTGTRIQFTLDSIFLYAKEVYYWQEALPTYSTFNPRNRYGAISSDIAAFKKELFDITQYKLNTNGVPYEKPISGEQPRYSYLEKKNSTTDRTTSTLASITAVNIGGSVIDLSTKAEINETKVGYLTIAAFKELNSMKTDIDEAFDALAEAGTETLIIDLRSNGGGYVETAEYIANQITPSSLNGKVMFSEQFNPILRSGKANILKNQLFLDAEGNTVTLNNGQLATMANADFSEKGNITHFSKKGKLETLKNVYFIVTGRTASASELLISCFKPYLPVRLVGQRTYGKPVGFFAVNIDQYSVYLASFLIRNADGWSDYFDGIPPDIHVTGTSSYPLGDPRELYLATALNDISGKSSQTNGLSLKTTAKVHAESESFANTRQTDVDFVPIVKQHFKLKE